MMVVVTYLLFANSMFFIFEGSAYTWNWGDLDTVLIGFSTTIVAMAWFMRRRLWPMLRLLHTKGLRRMWLVPSTVMGTNVLLSSSYIQFYISDELRLAYTLIAMLNAVASAATCFLVLDALQQAQDVVRYQDDMRLLDAQLPPAGEPV